MSWDIGDAVPLVYTIAEDATVVLTVTDPAGATSTPALTESGTAPAVTYSGAVAADQVGVWRWRFAATGAVTDSESGTFYVGGAPSPNVYTTLPELKEALGIPASDTVDDDDLADAALTASRAVDSDCGRHFYQISEARTMDGGRDGRTLRLGEYMDLVSVTTLKTNTVGDGTWPTTWAAGDFQLLTGNGTPNVNAAPEPQPYRQIRAVGGKVFPGASSYGRTDVVQITGVWGWPAVPEQIRRAARLMAAEVFKLKDAPLGAAGIGDMGIIRVRENPRYQRLIQSYQLFPVAVA